MAGSQCIFRLVGLLSLPPKLYFTSPQISAKQQGRNRKTLTPQLGRFPTAAACRENQHKFYLGVLHWPPEIHLTHLEGEAFELLLLILAFGAIRSLFTEHISLWGAFHYLELKASILPGNRVAPKCYAGSTEPHESFKNSLSSHLTFSSSIPSQASVSPFARSYFHGRLLWCQGFGNTPMGEQH